MVDSEHQVNWYQEKAEELLRNVLEHNHVLEMH